MKKETNNNPTQIAAFDSSYVLVAVFSSISAAASMTKTLRQSLIKAAYGEIISVGKKYWRAMPPDFYFEPDDIGNLTIFEFDSKIGVDRKIYSTKQMIKTTAMLESEYLQYIKNNK
jgi:hypothetical protein